MRYECSVWFCSKSNSKTRDFLWNFSLFFPHSKQCFRTVMISTSNAKNEKPDLKVNHKIHFNFFHLCIRYVQSSFLSARFENREQRALRKAFRESIFISNQKLKKKTQNEPFRLSDGFILPVLLCLTFYFLLLKWIEEKKAKYKTVIPFACTYKTNYWNGFF